MLIGICGLMGAGKDTIAARLVEKYGYEKHSWASPLKDLTASLFGWDRVMLEGETPESRIDREIPDQWWSDKLGIEWSPRKAMQVVGTNILRQKLHQDIWVLANLRRIQGKENVVIPDTRFPNEIAAIKNLGGQIWSVRRGVPPVWTTDLTAWKEKYSRTEAKQPPDYEIDAYMGKHYPLIHQSEYAWHGQKVDQMFFNDRSIEDLQYMVDLVIRDQGFVSVR